MNGGKIALSSFIENTTSSPDGNGNQFRLALHRSSTYSGGTTVTKQSIEADVTNALGTGSVVLTQNNSSTNNTRLYVAGNVTLPNDITLAQPNAFAGFGAIQYLAGSTGSSTLTGTITQQAAPFSGSTFFGPATTTTDVLNVNGPVNATGTATAISVGGNVGLGGGGSYPELDVAGKVFVNANNGIATNAVASLQGGTVELNGNNQSLAGLVGAGSVSNSSTTAATLTLNTAAAGTFSGSIGGNLKLVKSGSAVQTLAGVTNYTGATVINGGTLKLAAPNTSPVAVYSFDNIKDTSGNPVTSGGLGQGYVVVNSGTGGALMNGTVNNADNILDPVNGTATVEPGKFGNALHLDGLGSSVDINSQIVDQSGAGSWTFSAWVKTPTPGVALREQKCRRINLGRRPLCLLSRYQSAQRHRWHPTDRCPEQRRLRAGRSDANECYGQRLAFADLRR